MAMNVTIAREVLTHAAVHTSETLLEAQRTLAEHRKRLKELERSDLALVQGAFDELAKRKFVNE